MTNMSENGWVFGLHVKWLSENMYNLKNMPNSISAGAFLSLSLSLSLKQFTLPPLYIPLHPNTLSGVKYFSYMFSLETNIAS